MKGRVYQRRGRGRRGGTRRRTGAGAVSVQLKIRLRKPPLIKRQYFIVNFNEFLPRPSATAPPPPPPAPHPTTLVRNYEALFDVRYLSILSNQYSIRWIGIQSGRTESRVSGHKLKTIEDIDMELCSFDAESFV
ncbi:hypothetical protein EVAR_85257_1 [Eumeta japonica]|uniref:Uncharacterized protein n=1 Tax=Eumeta variegata TaxID=151549 RepID=A0A4C1V894_EUMVA|nr:hypothetical protein EVAR_85257_1 [Eumeta japonica]